MLVNDLRCPFIEDASLDIAALEKVRVREVVEVEHELRMRRAVSGFHHRQRALLQHPGLGEVADISVGLRQVSERCRDGWMIRPQVPPLKVECPCVYRPRREWRSFEQHLVAHQVERVGQCRMRSVHSFTNPKRALDQSAGPAVVALFLQ